MNTEHQENEIRQIRKQIRLLNITGGAAIASIILAGYMVVIDIDDEIPVNGGNRQEAVFEQPSISDLEENFPDEELKAESNVTNAVRESRDDKTEAETHTTKAAGSRSSLADELQSFEASCNNGSLVFSWVTMGASKHAFEIEKSTDHENYEVFTRAPQPEKKDGRNFYFVEEATSPDDQAFYRLRKVVGKGKYEYSSDIQVSCSSNNAKRTTVDVFPNGYGSFRILIQSPVETKFTVTLTDENEKELAVEEYNAKVGPNEFSLDSDSITRGNYTLRVSSDFMIKEKKVFLK